MKLLMLPIVVMTVVLPGCAFAQSQPYSGLQTRPIKALSEQQIEDLKAGRGMGLALAAELNGYPGPVHVLELGERLQLSDDQRKNVQGLLSSMKAETIPLGEKLIAEEAELDRQFARKTITPAILTNATRAIGATQAALRAAHLKYHLSTLDILEASQIKTYAELRGYSGDRPQGHSPGGHRH